MSAGKHKGTAEELGGSIKEAAGRVTGDRRMEAEGMGERVEGKAEENLGKVRDAVKGQFS